ncbi:LLM class flavin-dependent oxidoreductase, partial [Myxococcota bacterium]|nr:LLM class flavin-dependent oxidoreductase [Myxococcota bacterium]
ESLRRLTLPALERGLASAGRKRDAIEISSQLMICSGSSDEEIERVRLATKGQIAFYGSTPAYRPVLDVHGWGELQPALNRLSKEGKWAEMTSLVSDELLEAIAVCAPMKDVARKVRERCDGRVDRVSLVGHWTKDPDVWDDVVRDLSKG